MNTRVKVPRINRAKLIEMGLEKISHACGVHIREMRRFKPFDRRHKLHQGMLAQCFMAFKELTARTPCATVRHDISLCNHTGAGNHPVPGAH